MPDYRSPNGPPPFADVTCDELFEVLVDRIDKPHEYTHIIAELICNALGSAGTNIEFVDGVPMIPDPNRGKILSLARPIITAGDFGLGVKDRYLSIEDVPTAGRQGVRLLRPCTITGLSGQSRSTGDWILEIRKNGAAVTVASLNVTGGSADDSNMDIDMDEGDILQVMGIGTGIQHPLAAVELAWRKL